MNYTLQDFLRSGIVPRIQVLTETIDFSQIKINSVSVQELPIDNFIREDELVLSTAISCRENIRAFQELVLAAGNAGAAALALAFKDERYIVPPEVVRLASAIGLPLLLIPWEHHFSDILEAVLRAIEDKQSAMYQTLQTALFRAFFDVKPLSTAVSLISSAFRANAFVLNTSSDGLSTPTGDSIPFPGEFQKFKITISNATVGYLLLEEPPQNQHGAETKNRETLLQKYVCFPLSLWFNRKAIEDTVSARLKNDFVWNLATQNYSSLTNMLQQGKRLCLRLDLPYTCVILKVSGEQAYPEQNEAAASIKIESLLIQECQARGHCFMIAEQGPEFILYLENDASEPAVSIDQFLDRAEAHLSVAFPSCRFYWGVSEITLQPPIFHQLYQNAALSLQFCMNSGRHRHRFSYQDARKEQIVSVLTQNDSIQRAAKEAIAPLVQYHAKGRIDLTETLSAFISCNYNISLTARTLHIHRQTLLYRLEKIEALTGMSLSKHQDLFLLEIYLRIRTGY